MKPIHEWSIEFLIATLLGLLMASATPKQNLTGLDGVFFGLISVFFIALIFVVGYIMTKDRSQEGQALMVLFGTAFWAVLFAILRSL